MTVELLLALIIEKGPAPEAGWADRVNVAPGEVVSEAAHLPKHEQAARAHGETFNIQRDRLFLEQGLHHQPTEREAGRGEVSFVELVAQRESEKGSFVDGLAAARSTGTKAMALR